MDVDSEVLAGRYELGTPLGNGATSNTRRARDRVLDRPVAIKFFDPTKWASADGRARFEIEARLSALVNDPRVVTVYDVGLAGEMPYLVMECLPGATLADEIHEGPLALDRACDVLCDVLAGLRAAHECGVIHRDLKPANVLFDDGGRAKLADFGIATSDSSRHLTITGIVVGTPAYLSPERVGGSRATVRSDLYSVGVMAYEMLTGARPFTGNDPIAVAYAVHQAQPKPLRDLRPDVPLAVAAVVARAMAPDPDERFGSADEFATALRVAERSSNGAAETMPTPVVVPIPEPTRSLPVPAPARKQHRGVIIASVVALLVAVAIGIGLLQSGSSNKPAGSTTPSTVAPLPPALRDPFTSLEHAVQR